MQKSSVILLVQLKETEGIKRGSTTKVFTREEVEGGCGHKMGIKGGNDAKNNGATRCYPYDISQDRKVSYLVPTWQDFDALESMLEAVNAVYTYIYV